MHTHLSFACGLSIAQHIGLNVNCTGARDPGRIFCRSKGLAGYEGSKKRVARVVV